MIEKSVLQRLFEGKVHPSANIGVDNAELHNANKDAEEARVDFVKKLPESDRGDFDEIYELYDKAFRIYHYECFAHGFKLGVTLLHEALSDQNNLTKHSD